jgi:hypothetical protein
MSKALRSLIFLFFILPGTASLAQTTPDIDPRIRLHFTEQQVNEMLATQPLKIKVLNTYYRSSFVLITPEHEVCTTDPATIDITSYENLRKEDKRVSTGYIGTRYVIELLSKQELQALYDHLQ